MTGFGSSNGNLNARGIILEKTQKELDCSALGGAMNNIVR
jgi:hypothetical protein